MHDLLLNLVVVFEDRRIKGVTPLRAVEASKQLVIRVSALILIIIIIINIIIIIIFGADWNNKVNHRLVQIASSMT